MSGGYWEYKDCDLANCIFNWDIDINFEDNLKARKQDPMKDPELSEMVYDLFCLLHSADWYLSGDTGFEDYRADVDRFKTKWFGKTQKKRIKDNIDTELEIVRKDLYRSFGVKEDG